MSNLYAKTKAEVLSELTSELINAINPDNNRGLINFDKINLVKLKRKAEDLIDGSPARYYQFLGIIEAYQGNYIKAKELFDNALKLNKSDLIIQSNYLNIILRLGSIKEVGEWLYKHYTYEDVIESGLTHIYMLGLFELDFTEFKKYYKTSGHKLAISLTYKREYTKVNDFEKLAQDLDKIGIEKTDYSTVMQFIFAFFSKYSHQIFSVYFRFEPDYFDGLEINIAIDVDIDTAVNLTMDFNDEFVNFSLNHNRNDFLRKFAVYFKPSDMLKDDSAYISSHFTYEEMV